MSHFPFFASFFRLVAFGCLMSLPSVTAVPQQAKRGFAYWIEIWMKTEFLTFILSCILLAFLLLVAIVMGIFYIYKCFEWHEEKKQIKTIDKYAEKLNREWKQKFDAQWDQFEEKMRTLKPLPEANTMAPRKSKKCNSTAAPLHMLTKSGKETLHYGREIPREALVQKVIVSDDAPEKISQLLAEETQGKKKEANPPSVQGASIRLPSAGKYRRVPPPAKGMNNSVRPVVGPRSKDDVDASLSLTKGNSIFQQKKPPSAMISQLSSNSTFGSKQRNGSQDSDESETNHSSMPTD